MNKIVSVVIPTYNREAYILDAVKSVLNQKLPSGVELEVIVVDDGSTDNTEAILKSLGDKITYKKIANSGRPAVPRNIGIKLARGSLIAFQDSDDRWADGKIGHQIKAFDDPTVGLSHGRVEEMTASGKIQSGGALKSLQVGSNFSDLVQSNFVSTLTVMVRREVFEKVGFFDESNSVRGVEDYELWLRVASKYKLAFVVKTLAYYRRHEENISHSVDAEGEAHLYRMFSLTRKKGLYDPAQKIILNQKLLGLLPLQKMPGPIKRVVELKLRLTNKLLRLRVK